MPKIKRLAPLKPFVRIEISGGDFRATWDGSRPTKKRGHILPDGTDYFWSTKMFSDVQFLPLSQNAKIEFNVLVTK